MKTRLTQAKAFVQTHKTKLAIAAGFVAGAATVHYYYDRNTYLKLTDDEIMLMNEYGATGTFETKLGPLKVYSVANDVN